MTAYEFEQYYSNPVTITRDQARELLVLCESSFSERRKFDSTAGKFDAFYSGKRNGWYQLWYGPRGTYCFNLNSKAEKYLASIN